ncbi:twin-arginine translocase TatA/TatE family subunit [Brucella sp. IR073]|uniref:twin-arginine translocase TatA/TatE family subunit n=1 Tax=unclassified Brucella TaxID=2632610 RepID=UPI003B97D164
MGSFSIWHWLIVLAVVLLLFGRGKIPELMGDVAKGIKNFKQGMADNDEADTADAARTIDNNPDQPVSSVNAKKTSKS